MHKRQKLIPQTEGDVSRAEAEMTTVDNQELPLTLRDPYTLLRRAFDTRPKVLALTPVLQEANVYVDALIDNHLDLPKQLPSPTKSEGLRRPSVPRKKKR
jgi:hypothetical protein